jgi:transposase
VLRLLCLCLLLLLEAHVTARQTASDKTQQTTKTTTTKTTKAASGTKAAQPVNAQTTADKSRDKANGQTFSETTTATAKAKTKREGQTKSSAKTKGQTKAAAKGKTKTTTRDKIKDAAKAHKQRKTKAHTRFEAKREAEMRSFAVCNPNAAGIDVGQAHHWVCVGYAEEDNPELILECPTHSEGLRQIVAYLGEHKVTTVAMESTGVYWIALFELLQQEGFKVILVPPQYTRQVQGRPKTDKRDCQWIYRLHSVGLLPGAFRPPQEITVLRAYLRQRANIVADAARHINRMHKALEQMNLKLSTVVDDVTGLTGQKIIGAILEGERDPNTLAQLRHPKCKADAKQFALALDGTYRDEHLFELRQACHAWRFYQQQLDEVDKELDEQLQRLKKDSPLPPLNNKEKTRCGRKANDLRFAARELLYHVVGVDLTELEGLREHTALLLISEIGTDLSAFPTVKHFCSWLGLCPNFKKTGGKVKSSRTRPGQGRAAKVLRQAASSLHNSKGALGGFLRRLKGKLGMPAAITATAHKLARLVYYALTRGMTYV